MACGHVFSHWVVNSLQRDPLLHLRHPHITGSSEDPTASLERVRGGRAGWMNPCASRVVRCRWPRLHPLSSFRLEDRPPFLLFLEQPKADPGDAAGKASLLACLWAQVQGPHRILGASRRGQSAPCSQDVVGSGDAGGTTPAHSSMSAHKDSTASSRSI